MSKKTLLLVIVLGVMLVVFVFRFVFGGPEDTRICESGKWVRHGSPTATIPEEVCQ